MLEWLKGKAASHAGSTSERYGKPLRDFITHLGKRADLPLRAITPRDVRSYRDALREDGRAASTVNFAHMIIASALEAARRQAFIETNPAHAVDYLPTHSERVEKGILSPEEVEALTIAAPSDDWRGVILLAYLAGLRLKDCLSLSLGGTLTFLAVLSL